MDDIPAEPVARPDDHVGVARGPHELTQKPGIVRKVRIHLENQIVTTIERPPETRQIGLPQSRLSGTVEDMDAGRGRRELVRQLTGTVRRVIVHDQNFKARILTENGRHDEREIDPLVIGRDDDEKTLSHVVDEDRVQ